MCSAFDWREIRSPGHDELRCVLFLINGTVMEDILEKVFERAVGNCSFVLATLSHAGTCFILAAISGVTIALTHARIQPKASL